MSDEGTNEIVVGDVWPGHGKVVITIVAPRRANCLLQSVIALAPQFGGLDDAVAALHCASVKALLEAVSVFCSNSAQTASSSR